MVGSRTMGRSSGFLRSGFFGVVRGAGVLALAACTSSGGGGGAGEARGTATGASGDASSTTGAATSGGTASAAAGTGASTGVATAAATGTGGACGGAPVASGATTRTLEVAGKPRSYLLVVPDGYDGTAPMPVVFAWHARGTTAELARLYYKVEEAAAGGAIFVYPQGLPQPDYGNDTGWDLKLDGEDVQFFDAMFAEIAGLLCIDDARIFSTGHSFGAFMSNTLACARADRVRALGAVAGGGPYLGCTGPVAAWIAHGMSDSTVPFSQGEASRDFWVLQNGCSDETAPLPDSDLCVEYQGCKPGMPVVFCPHDEPDLGGHGWPSWAGPAIWDFFARF